VDTQLARSDVLIVDDDPGIRTLIAKILKRAGYTCGSVASGADAIPAIESEKPDVVLLDLMLPQLSGVEVLALLRERKPDMLPRIIILTAASQSDLRRVEPFRKEVFRLIRKPFDIGELTDAIRECSGRTPATVQGSV
jgi:DNA-binding response OmpR family regulator